MSAARWRQLALAASLVVALLMWLPLGEPQVLPTLWYEDKLQHVFVYLLLTLLWAGGVALPRAAWGVLLISALLEAGQLAIPERAFEPADLAANGLGVLLAVGLCLARRRQRRQRRRRAFSA